MPDWRREVRTRLAALDLPPAREADIVDELSQHLDDRWRELVAGGAAPDDATRLALAGFSGENLARHLASLRLVHQPPPIAPGTPGRRLFADLWQDLRYALRMVRSSPAFSTIAIVSLALGIGANTAIFSLWNGLLRAPLPVVKEPGQLVMFSDPNDAGSWIGRADGARSWLTYEEFEQLRDRGEGLSAVMASQASLGSWRLRFEDGGWEEASGRLVSGGFFQTLGVGAAIGRVFSAADDQRPAPDAVISHAYWQRRFGGRTDVVGRRFRLRDASFTIIGVAARGFIGETIGQLPDVWLPLRMQLAVLPDRDRLHDTPPRKTMWLHVFARLQPGVTPVQAEERANAVFRAGLVSFYGTGSSGERQRDLLNQRLQIRSANRGASATRHEFSQSLTALMASVGVVLLIACANLASLLLARATARRAEIALRLSLGASRGRLVRQLVTESLLLAVLGALGAVPIASAFHGALVRMLAASDAEFGMTFRLDPLLGGFVVATTFAATLVFGVLPAWQATRSDVGAALKDLGRGDSGALSRLGAGRYLVALQLACSLPLLVGAGLLVRTLHNLQRADVGFRADHLLIVRVDLREAGGEGARRIARLDDLVERIRRIPGVSAVSFSQLGLYSGGESWASLDVEGYVPGESEDRSAAYDVVGPGYFSTLGMPISPGRELLDRDRAVAPAGCVVNDAFARRFFERRNPIGMRITRLSDNQQRVCQVIGVVRNAHTQGLRESIAPRFFIAAAERPDAIGLPFVLVRTAGAPAALVPAVRAAVQQLDASMPIVSAVTIEQQMAPLTAQDRTTAQLAVVFGCVALALAAIGLYGVLSYGVVRRTAEIAIRLALGATGGEVVSMILRETIALVLFGLACGAALASVASRLVGSRLYAVGPQDPATFALSTVLLLLAAVAAAYLPARRASKLDPMAALRQ